jgi:hypothetical protein
VSKLILSALWVVPILGFAVLTAPADAHASGEEGSDTALQLIGGDQEHS